MSLKRTQQGFALMTAIFLLVVLTALGAAMLTFSSGQHAGITMDIQGSRAYWAARSGLEWGAYKVLVGNPGNTCFTSPSSLAVSGFNVSVSCAANAYDEGGTTIHVYNITSTAHEGSAAGSMGYVERQLQATISR